MQKITVQGFLNRFAERHHNRTDRPFCFVLGAGASRSSGIPTGQELVQKWLRELHVDQDFDGVEFDEWATAENLGIPEFVRERAADFYSDVYDRKFPEPQDGFAFLEQAMEGKVPSYGYSVLAHLLSETNHKVVITTNFDNLVADALSLHANTFPRVVGNDELVRYVLPELRRPLVAKIHGELGFAPKNRPGEIAKLSEGWGKALCRILERFTPVFIGYAGSDGSVMQFLEALPLTTPDTMFWCYRKGSPPTDRIQKIVHDRRGLFVEIDGFDEIMMQILDAVWRPNVPDLAKALETRSLAHVEAYKKQRDDLGAKLASANRAPRAPSQVRENAASVATPPADSADLLRAAGRVLASKDGEKTWWKWQEEIDLLVDVDAADALYRKAIANLPGSAPLLGNYAIFLDERRKDVAAAEAMYKRALEVDPQNPDLLGNYAFFLRTDRKNYDGAEAVYRRALEIDPKHINNLGNYAFFLRSDRKDYDAAEAVYKRALEAHPNDANLLGDYALFLRNDRKDHDAAEAMYRRALLADPKHANNLSNYAYLLRNDRKDSDAAEAMYRRAREADPKHVNSLINYAYLLRKDRKDSDAAEAMLKRALEVDPGQGNILCSYALLLGEDRKDYVTAETMFRRSLQAAPDDANLHANFARFLLASGRSGGLAELRRAMQLLPEDSMRESALECAFYLFAHGPSDERAGALRTARSLVEQGYRCLGWEFSLNIQRAIADGHPDAAWLNRLASVITGDAQPEVLREWAAWRDAKV